MIESYSFGRMVINGNSYTSDLIIFHERIQSSWWRKSGHKLCLEDIAEILEEKPEVLVIGTGYRGIMKINDEVKKLAQKQGIHLIIEKTPEAWKSFNTYFPQKKTVGAFHLTC